MFAKKEEVIAIPEKERMELSRLAPRDPFFLKKNLKGRSWSKFWARTMAGTCVGEWGDIWWSSDGRWWNQGR